MTTPRPRRASTASQFKRLTTTQVARLYNVHERTVRRWCESGRFVTDRTPGGYLQIYMEREQYRTLSESR